MPPSMVIDMARRNGLENKLPFRTVEEAEKAFQYDNLQEFLDLRDASLQVRIQSITGIGTDLSPFLLLQSIRRVTQHHG